MDQEKMNLVIVDVQKSGVKTYGPMSEQMVMKWLLTNFNDQPLGRIAENPRLFIADIDAGTMSKPTLKLTF